MDMNSFVWVKKKGVKVLRGTLFSASATLPIANNSLTSDVEGRASVGGGGIGRLLLPAAHSGLAHKNALKFAPSMDS